jgi:hypothetical protein
VQGGWRRGMAGATTIRLVTRAPSHPTRLPRPTHLGQLGLAGAARQLVDAAAVGVGAELREEICGRRVGRGRRRQLQRARQLVRAQAQAALGRVHIRVAALCGLDARALARLEGDGLLETRELCEGGRGWGGSGRLGSRAGGRAQHSPSCARPAM